MGCSHCLLPEIQTDVLLDKPSLSAEDLSLASSLAPCHTSWCRSLQKPLYQISTCSTFKREINSLFLSPSMKESQQHVGSRQRIEVVFSLKARKVKRVDRVYCASDLILFCSSPRFYFHATSGSDQPRFDFDLTFCSVDSICEAT